MLGSEGARAGNRPGYPTCRGVPSHDLLRGQTKEPSPIRLDLEFLVLPHHLEEPGVRLKGVVDAVAR